MIPLRRRPVSSDTALGAPGDRRLVLGVLTGGRIAMGLQFQSVGALSPLLAERLGIGGAELGILFGLFALPGVALALPGGMLGQRFGDRRLVLMGPPADGDRERPDRRGPRVPRGGGGPPPHGGRRGAAERAGRRHRASGTAAASARALAPG